MIQGLGNHRAIPEDLSGVLGVPVRSRKTLEAFWESQYAH